MYSFKSDSLGPLSVVQAHCQPTQKLKEFVSCIKKILKISANFMGLHWSTHKYSLFLNNKMYPTVEDEKLLNKIF